MMISNVIWAKDIQDSSKRAIASMKQSIRTVQARELLGKHYSKSDVSSFEFKKSLEKNIHNYVSKHLPKEYVKKSRAISQAIIDESFRNELDPYFLMAVIEGESSFNPMASGPVGELGLMQIRETTGKWMAELIRMKWSGKKMLKDPIVNIKLGARYLRWLREKFDGHAQLYLAAYNMGPGNVKDALSRNKWPKDYPRHVMKRYLNYYEKMRNDLEASLIQNVDTLSTLHQDMDLISL